MVLQCYFGKASGAGFGLRLHMRKKHLELNVVLCFMLEKDIRRGIYLHLLQLAQKINWLSEIIPHTHKMGGQVTHNQSFTQISKSHLIFSYSLSLEASTIIY